MTLHLAILRTAGLLAPGSERVEWLADWQSELWYVLRRGGRRQALAFTLGAFRDALWVRRSHPHPADWLHSPACCLSALAVLAAVCAFFFFRRPPADPGPVLAHILMVIIAIVILPATMPLTFAEYPRARRGRRWIFTALKLVLVLLIVFCGTFALAPLVSARLEAHATLIGYVLGFRWTLLDQRRRCPICLRLLANPARIGRCSHTLLEWYGTELVCPKGHGLLHVPEITASYTVRRWLDLDSSWSSLFS